MDPDNVEGNFNLGVLFLQQKVDLNQAINFFQRALKKDKLINQNIKKVTNPSELSVYQQYQEINRPHLIKCLYNIGMIYDRLGDISRASNYYRYAINKCKEDKTQQSLHQSYYAKSMTNYAVTLEKLGKRQEAIEILSKLKDEFREEIRILNNLGIISKRYGQNQEAEKAYQEAIQIDQNCFFPQYNMGVFKASHLNHEYDQEAITYFQKALELARINKEDVYEINVLVNMALIYERQKQLTEAIQCLEQAQQLDQLNTKIKQKLDQLKQQQQQQDTDIKQRTMINEKEQNVQQQVLAISQQQNQVNQDNQTKNNDQITINNNPTIENIDNKQEVHLNNFQKENSYNNSQRDIQMQQHQDNIINNQIGQQDSYQVKTESHTIANSRLDNQIITKEQQDNQRVNNVQSALDIINTQNIVEDIIQQQNQSDQITNVTIQDKQVTHFVIDIIQQNKQQNNQNNIQQQQNMENSKNNMQKSINNSSRVSSSGGNNTKRQIQSIKLNNVSNMMNNSGIIIDSASNSAYQSGRQQIIKNIDHIKLTNGLDTFLPKDLNDINADHIKLQHQDNKQSSIINDDNSNNDIQHYQQDQLDDNSNEMKDSPINEDALLNNSQRIINSRIQSANTNKSKQNIINLSQQEQQQQIDQNVTFQDQEEQKSTVIINDSKDKINKEEEFIIWTKQKCLDIIEQYTISQQNKVNSSIDKLMYENFIKAQFRLGIIFIQEKKYQKALEYLLVIDQQNDYRIMDMHLWMKIGEAYYKLDQISDSLTYFRKAEEYNKPLEDYLISMFIAKCLDKQKLFNQSIEQYEKALQLYKQQTEEQVEEALLGNIHFRLGWAYFRIKNIDKTIDHLKQANKLIPNNTDIMLKLANILFKEQNNFEESEKIVEKIIKINFIIPDAHLLMGKLQDKKDNHLKAIESFNIAIKQQAEQNPKQPPPANHFFLLGNAYEKQKDYKKCILTYKKCLTLDSKHMGACIHLANLLANIGEGQRAAKYFKHGLKIDENNVNARFGLAKTLQQFSENKDAPIEHFEKVIKQDPTHYKAFTQLGILYLDREEYEKSADFLKKALTVNKYFPLALVSLGNLLFETGHADEAIKYHKQALMINEKELQALIGLGNAYYDSNSPKEAISYYKRALQIDESLSDVHYNLGNALYLIENINDAITHYKAAIALNPKKPESFYNLGNALCVKNDYPNAVNSYLQALDLDPKNAPALYNLGNAYYMLNQFPEAIKVYLKALDINEESAECHFNLASAYNDVQNYQGAIVHYKRAVELDDSNTDAFICLGGVYEQLQQYDKAERYYKMVLQRENNNTKAMEALKKLKQTQNKNQ